jgi:hypothetical protein
MARKTAGFSVVFLENPALSGKTWFRLSGVMACRSCYCRCCGANLPCGSSSGISTVIAAAHEAEAGEIKTSANPITPQIVERNVTDETI